MRASLLNRHREQRKNAVSTVLLAEIGSLLGDPSRAHILLALLDGRALTSKELAGIAAIAPQTASGHLNRLVSANLLKQERQGRNHYFRLASPNVAKMLEEMLNVAAMTLPTRYRPTSRADTKMRYARTCYDHLAGWVGVALTDVLLERGHVVLADDGGEVTESGARFFGELNVELTTHKHGHRCMCRPCLDWTERRHHLAGRVGASLTKRLFDLGWISRAERTRVVHVTDPGLLGFESVFGLRLNSINATEFGSPTATTFLDQAESISQ
jgi:DNA-binding transcriptional ArsR family regulator